MSNQEYLLVPIKVKALVVNENVRKFQNFRRWKMNFQNLNGFMSPEAQPFGGGQDDFSKYDYNQGVYLHWELPAALRHGTQSSSGSIDFPLVPNRWLVVRFNGPLTQRIATAWVIESDFIDPAKGTNPFLDPTINYNPDQPVAGKTLLGRSLSLNTPQQWEETGVKALFLKAIGPGDAAFTAYQPIANNVFSFQDTLDNIVTDNLSYMVAGWYSDPSYDVLSNWSTPDDFAKLLADMNWQLGDGIIDTSNQSLYHGMVYGINWDLNGPSPSLNHDPKQMQISVGNTTIDALTALIKKQQIDHPEAGAIKADLIEAFQYNMLHYMDERNGPAKLDQKIKEAWFGSSSGGMIWETVDKPDINADNKTYTADYLAQEAVWVAELNSDQQEFDQAFSDLQTMQSELFAMWWKFYRAKNILFPSSDVPAPASLLTQIQPGVVGNLYDKVLQQISLVNQLASKLPLLNGATAQERQQQLQIFATGKGISSERILKQVPKPRFWKMNDPVIIINGAGYGNSQSIEDSLACRLINQTVTGMVYSPSGKAIAASDVAKVLPNLDKSNLPNGIEALWTEFFFLDPLNASSIAASVLNSTDPTTIQSLYDQMKSHNQVTGTEPSMIPDVWQQPWEPLFVEWKVNYFPIPYKQGNYLWNFNGTDYDWSGNGTITTSPYNISGRTFLTPQAQFSFKSRLVQFLKDNPGQADMTSINNFIQTIDNWDLLSQTLSGFQEQIKKMDVLSNVKPTGDIASLIGDQYKHVPKPDSVIPFDGVRAGQFAFTELKVYDGFGQAIEFVEDVPDGGAYSSDVFRPVISESLTPLTLKTVQTNNPFRFIQLPPRLLQDSRINFDFLDSKDDTKFINLDTGVNPVCAWLIPNHLDNGLFAFDQNGIALGELRVLIGTDNQPAVKFVGAPNSPTQSLADLNTINLHLGNMFSALVQQGPAAFQNFMTVIDSTLWTIDPLGGRSDSYFSMLIGRPLALVRSRLQFELNGKAIKDTSWAKTFETSDPDFINYLFSIRLGDQGYRADGLIGYYTGIGEDIYNSFNSVHTLTDLDIEPANQSFINPIGTGNYINLAFNSQSSAYLSMLVDPRASVYATTGILPVTTLQLPDSFMKNALKNMQITFKTGPILTYLQSINSLQGIVYPQPGEQKQNWSWVEKSLDSQGKVMYTTYPVNAADQTAKLSDIPNTIREGVMQLKLSNTPD